MIAANPFPHVHDKGCLERLVKSLQPSRKPPARLRAICSSQRKTPRSLCWPSCRDIRVRKRRHPARTKTSRSSTT